MITEKANTLKWGMVLVEYICLSYIIKRSDMKVIFVFFHEVMP